MNSRRAIRAARALSIYHDVCHNLETTPFTLIASLLADLQHLANELDVDWDGVLATANTINTDECTHELIP